MTTRYLAIRAALPLAALAPAACFNPDVGQGIQCSPEDECPGDLECRDNACYAPGTSSSRDADTGDADAGNRVDAAADSDAGPRPLLSWRQSNDVGPPERYAHAMAYHGGTEALVVFGGTDGVEAVGDTWVWNGSSWRFASPDGGGEAPLPRDGHAMAPFRAPDSNESVVVLFGGRAASVVVEETWLWDGGGWEHAEPENAPSARSRHAMAYDPANHRAVLFGGDNGTDVLGDTWLWDGQTWLSADDSANSQDSPPPRAGHAMAYDAVDERVLLFGGVDSDGDDLGDTWAWDGERWHELAPAVAPPPANFHAMASDTASGPVVLFGGDNATGAVGTWLWDGGSWSELNRSEAPSERTRHAMAYDAARDEIVLYGGVGSEVFDDVWVFETPSR